MTSSSVSRNRKLSSPAGSVSMTAPATEVSATHDPWRKGSSSNGVPSKFTPVPAVST